MLARTLAVLVFAALPVFAPEAAAFGEPSGHIDGSVTDKAGPLIDSFAHDSGPVFSFTRSDSVTESGNGASGAASLTYFATALTANVQGQGSANTGSNTPREVIGNTTYNQEFVVTQPMQYSASGSLSVSSTQGQCCVISEVRLEDDQNNRVFRVLLSTGSPPQNLSAGGVLQPGEYTLNVQAGAAMGGGAAANVNISGSGQFDINFALSPPNVPVRITSSPPPTTTDTNATFSFETVNAPPPPGHFECRIDDLAFAECASPKTFTNVPLGDHRVQVRYKPDSGAAGEPAEATWKVVPNCPDVTVGLATAQGCFTERQANGAGTGVFETEQDAWIGGFHVRPRPGGKLVVQNRTDMPLAAEGAGVDWVLGDQLVPAPLGEIQPFVPDFTFSLNTAGTFERFIQLPLFRGTSAQLKVTWDGGGRGSKVEASVSIEELTKSLGTPLAGRLGLGGRSVGTLSGKLGFTLANGKPAELADGELELPEFAVEIKGTDPKLKEGFGGGRLKARRVGTSVEWSGEVTTLFPWQGRTGTNQGSLTGRLFLRDSALAGVGFALSGFEQPIGRTGWDLTGIEGDVIYNPAFALNIGARAQQRPIRGISTPLLKYTGNLKALALAAGDCASGSNPYAFVGTFNAPPLEELELGEFKGTVTMCAYLQGARNFAFEAGVSGELTIDVLDFKKLISAQGSAKGWFQGFDFNLDGSYQLRLPIIGTIGANGVFSSEGYAVCGRYGFISAGIATNNWLEAPQDVTGCDFTPFRAVASARAAGSGTRDVAVPPGQSAFGMAVRGADGAPRLRVTGPAGESFESPSGDEPLESSSALIHSIDELKTTYVYLRRPRAGTWRVEPLDGAPISRIETGRQLPKPRVRARVRKRGGKVVVNWNSRRVPGQRIELVDRADGVATTIQRPTSKLRGRARFAPANPLATRRTIEAVLTQNGSPRPTIVAARYRIRAPKRPAKVRKLRARRSGATLAVRWAKAARAKEYLVTVSSGSTVLTRALTTRPRLTYTEAPAGKLTIRIVPRDRFGRGGRGTTLRR